MRFKLIPANATQEEIQQAYMEMIAKGGSTMDSRSRAPRAIERRFTTGEVEVRQRGSKIVIEGHAIVWNRMSEDLGGFKESVRPGAARKTIMEADVRALMNHDPNLVLGRNKAGTVRLSEDTTGLLYEIVPPNTTYARDLMVSMERGDINNSSFGFRAIQDDWGVMNDYPHRSLIEIALADVSVVTYPAYLDADSGLAGRKAALSGVARRSSHSIDELLDPATLLDAVKGLSSNEPEERAANALAGNSTRSAEWAQAELARIREQEESWKL